VIRCRSVPSFLCLALAEILAEKIRACYQQNKARDMYDLGVFATRPLNQALIRRLVVLKLWQARDTFDAIASISPYLTEHINRFGDYILNLDRKPPQPDYGYTLRSTVSPR
jgi:hypothetical protein